MSDKSSIMKTKRAEYNKRYYEKNRDRILQKKKLKSKLSSSQNISTTVNEASNKLNPIIPLQPKCLELRQKEPMESSNEFSQSSRSDKNIASNLLSFPVQLSTPYDLNNDLTNIQYHEAVKPLTQDIEKVTFSTVVQEWKHLALSLLRPGKFGLLLVSFLLTSVMVLQGASYFGDMGEANPFLAATVVELLLVVGSVALVITNGATKKAIWLGLGVFVVIYGAGLYSHFNQGATEKNPLIEQVTEDISEIKSEIVEVKKQRDSLPANFLTKRSELTTKRLIPLETSLEKAKVHLQQLKSSTSQQASVVSVAFFRLLLMLLNAFVVHRLAELVITYRKSR